MATKIYQNLIGGQWVNAESGKTFLNHNPANVDDVVGEFQASGEAGRGSRGGKRPALRIGAGGWFQRLSGERFSTARVSCCCGIKRILPGR